MITSVIAASKAASPGSPYAMSNPDVITVPNPTPLSEAIRSDAVDPPPDIDVHAMIRMLEPIAETLNEAAEEAMYPTPPINTPAITSPATSAIYLTPRSRLRGMSTLGDRLARAKIDKHRFMHRDSDVFSNSDSVRSVLAEDDSDSVSDMLSDRGRDRNDSKLTCCSLTSPQS